MRKRFLAILCVFAMILALFTGCVNKGDDGAATEDGSAPTEATDTAATEGIQADPDFYAKADLW